MMVMMITAFSRKRFRNSFEVRERIITFVFVTLKFRPIERHSIWLKGYAQGSSLFTCAATNQSGLSKR